MHRVWPAIGSSEAAGQCGTSHHCPGRAYTGLPFSESAAWRACRVHPGGGSQAGPAHAAVLGLVPISSIGTTCSQSKQCNPCSSQALSARHPTQPHPHPTVLGRFLGTSCLQRFSVNSVTTIPQLPEKPGAWRMEGGTRLGLTVHQALLWVLGGVHWGS